MKDIAIKESNFVRTAPVFNQRDSKIAPANPILNPQTATLCEMLGIDDPVQVLLARTGRVMKQPEKLDSPIVEPVVTESPTSIIQCSKLSLPEPVTPTVEKIELESKSTVADDSLVTDSLNTTEECATPMSSKKTFKRRNMSIYTPDKDENSASLLESEGSPCKLPC